MTGAPQYDVAVSFLQKDEPLALKIHSKLGESLSVFVYSKKQDQLAGTDGLESFRQVFRTDSRMVVVLYRAGWGQTPWTRVEEGAIKDRFLDQGWDWLLFVMLDDADKPPVWLPKSEIRLSYSQYGFDQLIGAIKFRAERLGSTIKTETALDRAKRLNEESIARAERDRLLAAQGRTAAAEEHKKLCEFLDARIEQLNEALTSLKIESGFDRRVYTLRTQHVSLNFYLYQTQPATESRIVIQEFNGPNILPQNGARAFLLGEEPQVLTKREFYFDYQGAYGWCWRHGASGEEFQPTAQLAEHILKLLLDLHDKFEKGQIQRRSLR